MPYTKQSYRWVILALLWILYVSLGLVMGSMAPLVTPIIEDFNMSYSQMGLILGSWQLVYIATSIVAGNLIDRWGERKSLLAGVLVVALSAGLRFFSNGFATMLPAVALLGVGGPMISIGGPKTISLWFEGKRRGTALGIFITGSMTGMLLGFSLTNSVIMPLTNNSWRITFLSYGILALAAGLLWWFFAREIRLETTTEKIGVVTALRQIVRIRNVQLILIMGMLNLATIHGLMNWLPNILETGGMSPALAGFAASAYIIAGIPAVIVFPHVIPLHFRGRALALSATGIAIALCGVIITSGVLQFVVLLILGLVGSAFGPIILLILMDSCGIPSDYLGSANGAYYCVAEIGGFLAPLLMGALYDMTDGFLAGALLLAALNIVIIPITFRLRIQTSDPTPEFSKGN
jgi:cyanate permease